MPFRNRKTALRSFVALLLLAAAAPQQLQKCLDKYRCTFHQDVDGQEYSWDLHQLCHAKDYSYSDGQGHLTLFNICGYAEQTCAPGFPTYNTHGSAVQVFTEQLIGLCNETDNRCMDYDLNTTTCCTGLCYVFGVPKFSDFELLDPTNPELGVKLVYAAMPPL